LNIPISGTVKIISVAHRIDSHQHFWIYSPEEYAWISSGMEALRRNFLPSDLAAEREQTGVQASVAVQARQTVQETEWLLQLADKAPSIAGVVGWVSLVDKGAPEQIERLAAHPRLRGLRHVLQDEADDHYILRPDFNAGVAALKPYSLVYDILIFEKHLPQTIEFVDRHPDQIFVLDHIAKPRIRDGSFTTWREQMQELARRPNVYCKVSGMVTEADWNRWTTAELQRYFDAVLDLFTPKRLMFGSDWPVLLVASSYGQWVQTLQDATAALSTTEQERVWGETAAEAYGLTSNTNQAV
jgi:L-fuconolactonase